MVTLRKLDSTSRVLDKNGHSGLWTTRSKKNHHYQDKGHQWGDAQWKRNSWSPEVRPSTIHPKALICSIVTNITELPVYHCHCICAAAGTRNTLSPGFRAGLAFLCFLLTTVKNLKHQFYRNWMVIRHWPQNRHATESPGGYGDKEDVAHGLELPPQLPMNLRMSRHLVGETSG